VDPALSLDRLGPDRAAIILEFALDSVLAAVEMNLGCKLAVDSFSGRVERLENDGQLPLFFTLVIEGLVTTGCELRIPPDYALRLAEGLDRHAGISPPVLDLPIPVCLRVAAANLAAAEIERLSPDDVVLVDASCEPGDAVIAVIGERLVAPVTLAPEGPRLATHPIPGATSSWAWSMPTDAMAGAWEADAETDNRSLHVLFEIGRFELPASQVKQLAPNFLLPLEPLHDQTVDIVVDGQRIGRGTLMRIGNRTGVRVIAVRERRRPAAGLKRAPAGEAPASSEEPAARSVRRERKSDPETDQEAGNIREGILRDTLADRVADEQIDQRRILDNRDSEASRFGDHLIAGLAATLAADQRHRRFFAVV
jgi:type III secretion protein Q